MKKEEEGEEEKEKEKQGDRILDYNLADRSLFSLLVEITNKIISQKTRYILLLPRKRD